MAKLVIQMEWYGQFVILSSPVPKSLVPKPTRPNPDKVPIRSKLKQILGKPTPELRDLSQSSGSPTPKLWDQYLLHL